MRIERGTIVQLIAKSKPAKEAIKVTGENWFVEEGEDMAGNIVLSHPRFNGTITINIHNSTHFEVRI